MKPDAAFSSAYSYSGPFQNLTLQPLPYPYEGLEPYIDTTTMKLHHDVHNKAYITNANAALAEAPQAAKSLTLLGLNHNVGTDLFGKPALNTAFQNNAGGAWNHAFFFKCMSPAGSSPSGNAPAQGGALAKAIDAAFGNFTAFKANFSEGATKRFGSGFEWLLVQPDSGNKLVTTSTPNQDNPLQQSAEVKGIPILTLDVWEHAYYLKYNATRPAYIKNWWNVVNWPYVEENYGKATQGVVPVVASS
ncbi:hypothetical protein WJX81_000999 [Elliptochloris bilobata]|uniref:Superoxide dismutase n=1 Tax=Elliptochloris bilobata TaxID=381761 RepID=A0AAW1RIB0_9CHLO